MGALCHCGKQKSSYYFWNICGHSMTAENTVGSPTFCVVWVYFPHHFFQVHVLFKVRTSHKHRISQQQIIFLFPERGPRIDKVLWVAIYFTFFCPEIEDIPALCASILGSILRCCWLFYCILAADLISLYMLSTFDVKWGNGRCMNRRSTQIHKSQVDRNWRI